MLPFRTGPPSSAQALDRLPSALDLFGLRVDGADSTSTHPDDTSTIDLGDIPVPSELSPAVDHFFSLVNPAYPIFHEPTVRQDVAMLSDQSQKPSAHTLHTVYGEYRGRPHRAEPH